ncbi:fosfomycin resistance protein FosB [Paenibacillus sp. PCH8]|uniref:metallothiol transferase FosB n=1 Tax=Paenibacillus sp. PCH8 TaxID=2066524 RepID=UPI000CFA0B0B|nr:metallothiol transferase FosB [Paenibacillus sp. PCH8]PQP83678.1 fosfomycin resistance protein FosB [Paenibacillus sp. PCH8]
MNIQGMNHLCFSVSNLERSITFYEHALGARIQVKGRKLAYFELAGLWIALNQEDVIRNYTERTYTHIAFTVREEEFDESVQHLRAAGADILPGRPRDPRDAASVYFTDPDGHLFELHTGTMKQRLDYYREDKDHMVFYP